MQEKKIHCTNMNHSKANPPIQFCPTCGDKFNTTNRSICSAEIHKLRRKERSLFCSSCGYKLMAQNPI